MNFIKSENYRKGAEDVAKRISTSVAEGKKVLWFLTGGSSIPSCVRVLEILREKDIDLKKITVTLTDERYGEVGHSDSSWKKLKDAGFDFEVVNSIPVLCGLSLEETFSKFENSLNEAIKSSNVLIAQFGVGADVHIAGILPKSEGTEEKLIVKYQGPDFMRITLGFLGIKKIQSAFVFIFGDAKLSAIKALQSERTNVVEEPAQILKSIREVSIYSDVV